MRLAGLLSLLLAFSIYTNPPDVVSASPDQVWSIDAKWTASGSGQEGYSWTLKNLKTGRAYFGGETPQEDAAEALPKRLKVLWSPGSQYVALELFFDEDRGGVVFVSVGAKPEIIHLLAATPLKRTLIRADDLPAWDGSGVPQLSLGSWLNDTDLMVNVEMKTFLRGNAPKSLDAGWRKTIHFSGKTLKVINSICDRYDLAPMGD